MCVFIVDAIENPTVKSATIERVPSDTAVSLSGDPAAAVWKRCDPLRIEIQPWRDEPVDLTATLRLCYDEDTLYLQFLVEDDHIQAEQRTRNGEVWLDSCVELFVSPGLESQQEYLNFEANCVGQIRVGFGPNRQDRRRITPGHAQSIQIEGSVDGPTKEPTAGEESWWLAATIPFEPIGDLAGVECRPESGDVWQGNAYVCRGPPETRHVAWNPIDTPEPDFHRPEYFGEFSFE